MWFLWWLQQSPLHADELSSIGLWMDHRLSWEVLTHNSQELRKEKTRGSVQRGVSRVTIWKTATTTEKQQWPKQQPQQQGEKFIKDEAFSKGSAALLPGQLVIFVNRHVWKTPLWTQIFPKRTKEKNREGDVCSAMRFLIAGHRMGGQISTAPLRDLLKRNN